LEVAKDQAAHVKENVNEERDVKKVEKVEKVCFILSHFYLLFPEANQLPRRTHECPVIQHRAPNEP
jgi:hypothetical protein